MGEQETSRTEEQEQEQEREHAEEQGADSPKSKGEERDFDQEVEDAKEEVKELEEDPPEKLEDWPSGRAKYETFGGPEHETSYKEAATSKLGPSDVRFHEDGKVEVEGEEADDPDGFKAAPIPAARPTRTPPASPARTGRSARSRPRTRRRTTRRSRAGRRERHGRRQQGGHPQGAGSALAGLEEFRRPAAGAARAVPAPSAHPEGRPARRSSPTPAASRRRRLPRDPLLHPARQDRAPDHGPRARTRCSVSTPARIADILPALERVADAVERSAAVSHRST